MTNENRLKADDEKKSTEEESIFKVDTVPPPAGDDDAYSAPTKVGPASVEGWVELMRAADNEGKQAAAAAKLNDPSSKRPPASSGAPASGPVSSGPKSGPVSGASSPPRSQPKPIPREEPPDDIVRINQDDGDGEEESNAATLVHPLAKGLVDGSQRADASVFGSAAASPPAPTPPPSEPTHLPGLKLGPAPLQQATPAAATTTSGAPGGARRVVLLACAALLLCGLLVWFLFR